MGVKFFFQLKPLDEEMTSSHEKEQFLIWRLQICGWSNWGIKILGVCLIIPCHMWGWSLLYRSSLLLSQWQFFFNKRWSKKDSNKNPKLRISPPRQKEITRNRCNTSRMARQKRIERNYRRIIEKIYEGKRFEVERGVIIVYSIIYTLKIVSEKATAASRHHRFKCLFTRRIATYVLVCGAEHLVCENEAEGWKHYDSSTTLRDGMRHLCEEPFHISLRRRNVRHARW